MSATDIPALRRLISAATAGPWLRYGTAPFEVYADPTSYPDGESPYVTDGSPREADAEFIVAARTALPAALDEIERLRVERDWLLAEADDDTRSRYRRALHAQANGRCRS